MTDLRDIVRHGVHWLAPELEHAKITFRVDLPPRAVWVCIDSILIEPRRRPVLAGQCGDIGFFFLSTPSLYADSGVLVPAGSTTVQINVASDFEWFATAAREGRHAHETARIAEEILAAVERRLLADLRRYSVAQEVWSPVDLAAHVGLERGGMYGARLDFPNRVLHRVSQRLVEQLPREP